MADETVDKVIRTLLGIGLLLGVVLGIEMVAGASWWSASFEYKAIGQGGLVYSASSAGAIGGKTLLGASPVLGALELVLSVGGFFLTVLTVGPREFLPRLQNGNLLKAIGGVGLLLALVGTQAGAPGPDWKLTGAWIGLVVAWLVYLLTLLGLLSTRPASLES